MRRPQSSAERLSSSRRTRRDAAPRSQPTAQLTCAAQEAHAKLKAAEQALAGRACLATLEGHTATVSALIAAPCAAAGDGSPQRFVLATAASDGGLRLWDAAAGSCAGAAAAHADGGAWAAWAPDARALATAGADGTLRLWRVTDDDACAAPPQQLHELKVRSRSGGARHVAAAHASSHQRSRRPSLHDASGARWAMHVRHVHAGRRAAGELRRRRRRARVARRRRLVRARRAGPHKVHRLPGASACACAA